MVSKYVDVTDKYTYPGTSILINNFNELDQKTLEEKETSITTWILIDLHLEPIRGNFDFFHLQAIHSALFCAIYPFAGEVREVSISKGQVPFCLPIHISSFADYIFSELKKDNHLKGLEDEHFKEKLIYYMGELNALHPFREGNGRALREFFRVLCLEAGWSLEYDSFSEKDRLDADIALFYGNDKPMRDLLNRGLVIKN